MKKGMWVVLFLFAIALTAYIVSSAQVKVKQSGRPEDIQGKEASSYEDIVDNKTVPGKGSEKLKVTGPVWVEE